MRDDRVRSLVGELRDRPGYVLFEAPPPDVAVDGQVLAAHADAILVVVEITRTRMPALIEAFRRFDEVRARVAGAVVVGRLRGAERAEAEPAPRPQPAAEPGSPPPEHAESRSPVEAEPLPVEAVGSSAVVDVNGNPVPGIQDEDTVTFPDDYLDQALPPTALPPTALPPPAVPPPAVPPPAVSPPALRRIRSR
jgi:hypothetical protein